MVIEKNLKKTYRATLFTRIQKIISKSGKTTNRALIELKREYPTDYTKLRWKTVQDRLVKLHEDKLIQLNIVQSNVNPVYVWSEV